MGCGNDWTFSDHDPVVECCEHGSGHTAFTQGWHCLEYKRLMVSKKNLVFHLGNYFIFRKKERG